MNKLILPLTLLLLLTTIVSFPNIIASDNYTESLSVTVSGDLAYWSISLSDVNATGVVSSSISSSGIDSFEIFHYSHQGSFQQRSAGASLGKRRRPGAARQGVPEVAAVLAIVPSWFSVALKEANPTFFSSQKDDDK